MFPFHMIGWVFDLMFIIGAMLAYSVPAAVVYRAVYGHFYEEWRGMMKEVRDISRDNYGRETIKTSKTFYDHDRAHSEAIFRAIPTAALWPITLIPLLIFAYATPTTPEREIEKKETEELRRLYREERRKELTKLYEQAAENANRQLEGHKQAVEVDLEQELKDEAAKKDAPLEGTIIDAFDYKRRNY